MPGIAFALPLQAGKAEVLRRFLEEHTEARGDEFHETRRGRGVRKVRVWRQHSPQEMIVVYLEGDDLERAFEQHRSSDHQFDQWFKEMVEQITGHHPDRFAAGPPADLIFEWDESGTIRHQAHKVR